MIVFSVPEGTTLQTGKDREMQLADTMVAGVYDGKVYRVEVETAQCNDNLGQWFWVMVTLPTFDSVRGKVRNIPTSAHFGPADEVLGVLAWLTA